MGCCGEWRAGSGLKRAAHAPKGEEVVSGRRRLPGRQGSGERAADLLACSYIFSSTLQFVGYFPFPNQEHGTVDPYPNRKL